MIGDKKMESRLRPGLLVVAAMVLLAAVAFVFANPVSAGGATRVSGIGVFDPLVLCDDAAGAGADYALSLTGDLEGCLYVTVESASCSPGGVYNETGTELYIGSGGAGDDGTFETTYRFVGKFEDCPNLIGQINGRCRHKIVAGTGTDDDCFFRCAHKAPFWEN